ncbi:MAG: hypothetical protein WCY00_01550 [Candidatus Dojkabacteria bacterium]
MKLKKLDSEHIFLQFLMLFFSLVAFLLFSFFTKPQEIWTDTIQKTLYIFTITLSLLVGGTLLFRVIKKKTKEEVFWALGFLLVGVLDIFSLKIGGAHTVLHIISRTILTLTFFLVWFLNERKRDEKVDKREEIAKRILMVFLILIFFCFLFFLSWRSIFVRSYTSLIFSSIILMFLTISLVGNMFLKEWRYRDFNFWILFSLAFLIVSEVFFFDMLGASSFNSLNLSMLSRIFGQVAFLIGVLNNFYIEKLDGKVTKNKKVSKKI